MTLSIIIPVYRVELTLQRCLESIVAQTFQDFEVILVDDGSPDGCPVLCDEWGRADGRIVVVHKQNGGLSDARNAGLERARGALVTFVDSDDYLSPDTYRQAVDAMTAGVDIVEFPVCRFEGSPWQQLYSPPAAVYYKMEDYWLRGRAYEHSYACNKVYRRTLFCGVRFPLGRVFEDVATLPLLLAKARCVVTIAGGQYHYCLNAQGITATAQADQLQQLLEAHVGVMGQWCDDRYYMHVLNIQADVWERTAMQPLLKRRCVNPFAAGLNTSQRIKAVVVNVFGVKWLCKLNKLLHRWKKPSRS